MLKLRTANLDSSQPEGKSGMNKQRLIQMPPVAHDNATSIIGLGMTVVGACKTEGQHPDRGQGGRQRGVGNRDRHRERRGGHRRRHR